ncbi:MAG: hypothetical protein C0404_03915 [Verrucomicrobia bacterium]|nr:hypothetical protein [Verrucomicrobiota bacterium]
MESGGGRNSWFRRNAVLLVFFCTIAYAAVSLRLFQRQMPPSKIHTARTFQTGIPLPQSAANARTPTQVAPDRSSGQESASFTAPTISRDFINLAGIPATLRSQSGRTICTVQVLATCDHHFNYSHTYPNCEINPAGTTLFIPLRGDAAYWQADGHDGQWSEWESVSLRSIKIKVFTRNTPASNIRASFGETRLEADNVAPSLTWLQPIVDPIPLGERYEIMFDIANWRGNPFIPADLSVSLEVSDPQRRTHTIPAFLNEEYKAYLRPAGEEITPRGAKHWRARFRPFVEGEHSYSLKYSAKGAAPITLKKGSFKVSPGKAPNYSCIQPASPRWFRNTDGTFYYPVGWNIVTPVDQLAADAPYVTYLPEKQTLTMHQKMVNDLANHGGNFYGLWMTIEWCGLEGPPHLGDYSGYGRYNLKNAWIADQLVKTSERRGVRILFDTINAGQIEGYWDLNPYSRQGGGFLDHTAGFWTDERAIALQLGRLRYIVGRYADSPAIHAWDYMSEPDRCCSAGCSADMVTGGIARYLRYMKQIDTYKHIGTSHANNPTSRRNFCDFPEVEFPHFNNYTYPDCSRGFSTEQLQAIRDSSAAFDNLRRPMMVKEYGGNYKPDSFAKVTRDILGGLWAGACSRMAGTPMTWWSNFMYGDDLGPYYGVIAAFMQGEDLATWDTAELGGWNNLEVRCSSRNNDARALMSGNKTRRFLFVYNFQALCREVLVTRPCSNVEVTFSGLRPGTYEAEYWDLLTGKRDIRQILQITGDRGAIRPPDFKEGWAIKIRPVTTANAKPDTVSAADPGAAATTPAERPDEPCKWSWRVTPLLKICYERAATRCAIDFTLALPPEYAGWAPIARTADGTDATFAWQYLADGKAVRIRMPAARKGPFDITLSRTPRIPASEFDDSVVGADTESFYGVTDEIRDVGAFKDLFDSRTNNVHARVERIEHFNNPTGINYSHFLSRYRAPLFVPRTGKYTFAVNSDDGGVIAVDGKVAASWLGSHNAMEYGGRTSWQSGSPVQLEEGVHWLAVYHQQLTGRTFIQANWLIPVLQEGSWQKNHFVGPFGSATPGMDVIDSQYLSGLIPCSVDVVFDGQSICRLTPSRGLELRKPHTRVFTVGVEGSNAGGIRTLCFKSGGWQNAAAQGRQVPAWAGDSSWRRFSLEWDQGNDTDDSRFMMTRTFDIDLPLAVSHASRASTVADHKPRKWQTWKLEPADMGKPFTVALAGVELVRETVKPWPFIDRNPAPARLPKCSTLVQPAAVLKPCTIPTAALSGWFDGPSNGTIPAECFRFDLWLQDDQALGTMIPKTGTTPGIVLLLDNTPMRLGLGAREFLARMDTHIRGVIAAGALPVLVVDGSTSMESPLNQEFALSLVHLQKKYGCPFIDLRKQHE